MTSYKTYRNLKWKFEKIKNSPELELLRKKVMKNPKKYITEAVNYYFQFFDLDFVDMNLEYGLPEKLIDFCGGIETIQNIPILNFDKWFCYITNSLNKLLTCFTPEILEEYKKKLLTKKYYEPKFSFRLTRSPLHNRGICYIPTNQNAKKYVVFVWTYNVID